MAVLDVAALAYDLGLKAGGDAMRDAIIAATQGIAALSDAGCVPELPPASAPQVKTDKATPRLKAPKGTVGNAVKAVLSVMPGRKPAEIGPRAKEMGFNISVRSVAGELKRFEGQLYRIEQGRWYLIGESAVVEDDQPPQRKPELHSSSGLFNDLQKEDEHDPATIAA